ncbi:MAG: putative porin [Weeksellaceae bacterium]|jgi:hypothetical protein|nr:putative porin [Weeksellaceae bacterium]
MRHFFLLFFLLFGFQLSKAQIITPYEDPKAIQDSLVELSKREVASDSLSVHRPVIADYKFWKENDLYPTPIDTSLVIQNLYTHNFTQKDLFGKLYFPNFGQTFNPLEYSSKKFRMELLPQGKSVNYIYPDEVNYYDVKTPMTEFIYENGMREGQYLSTTFAHNLTPQFNYSVRYRGLRSVGRYQNNLAANNALIATLHFKSKNKRLKFWSHFASQKINNQENGGIKDLNEFVYDDSLRTTNRQNIEVNLKSAYTEFDSRRFHLGTSYQILGKSDSLQNSTPLLLKNIFTYEKQKYFYHETNPEDYYESAVIPNLQRRNLKNFETLQNTSTIEFKWSEKLLIEAGIRYEKLKTYYGNEQVFGLIAIPGHLEDNLLGAIGRFYFDWNERLKLNAYSEFKSGTIFKNQYHLQAEIDIQPLQGYHLIAGALLESAFPSLNLFYNQSFYKDFNYYNSNFHNTNTRKLYGKLDLNRIKTRFEATLHNIDNYVYINSDFRPKQLSTGISILQFKADNLFSYRNFYLHTTAEYQKVTQNSDFLPLPEIIARATLYWQGGVFANKAELQTGITANYFTPFKSREFFPVLNEFMLPRENAEFGIQEIGGFPLIDLFINLKVNRMQIFLRGDHLNALWGKNNYYSAPFTPYRDFKIQMGITWYLLN